MLTPEELKARWETEEGKERLAAVVRTIRAGNHNWEDSLKGLIGVDEVENGRDLRFVSLINHTLTVQYTGQGADFSDSRLEYANLYNAGLKNADFVRANLRSVNLGSANLENSRLTLADLTGINLVRAILINAQLDGAHLEESTLTWANMEKANLYGTSIVRSNLLWVKFKEANLRSATFNSVALIGADLTGAKFSGCSFIGCNLENIRFETTHSVAYDGSDTIVCARRDRVLNWKKLSFIGKLPFFEVSWIGFTIALVIIFLTSKYDELIDSLGQYNDFSKILVHFRDLHASAPHLIWLALFSTFFLLIGSICYRLFCPSAIQEFSEEAWVSEHKQPRLIYFRESWSKARWQWVALLATVTGGFLLLCIIVERLVIILSNFPNDVLFYSSISIGILLSALVIAKIIVHWDWVVEKWVKLIGKENKKE